MPFQEKGCALGLLGGFLGRLCRGLRCFPGLGGLTCRPVCRRILLLQFPFLPQAGDGIGCKLGVLRHGFPIVEIRIGLDRRLLRLYLVSPGFQLAFRPPVLDTAVSVAHSLLKAAFPQGPTGRRNFLLHLPDLAVDGCARLLDGAGQQIGVGLSRILIGDRVPAASSRSAALSDLRMAPCSSGWAGLPRETVIGRMGGSLPPCPPDRSCAVSGASFWLLPVPGAVPHGLPLFQRRLPCRRMRNGPAPAFGQRDRWFPP